MTKEGRRMKIRVMREGKEEAEEGEEGKEEGAEGGEKRGSLGISLLYVLRKFAS